MERRFDLTDGEVQIWISRVDDWAGRPEFDRLLECLSKEETQRRAKFVFEKDRDVYGLAHAMIRHALSACEPKGPEAFRPDAWTFQANEYGKPTLIAGQSSLPIRFNLSHTPGMAACAIALDREIGIDLENADRPTVDIDVASRSFSPAEREDLAACDELDRRRRFFEIWTAKEAFIKAIGTGLSTPLESFSVRFDPSGVRLVGCQGDWTVICRGDWPPYVLSAAVEGGFTSSFRFHELQP